MSAPSAPSAVDAEPSSDWLEPDCGLCGASEPALRFRAGRFALVYCRRCAHVYVTPRRTLAGRLREVYDASYWRNPRPRERGYADYRAARPLQERTFARRLAVLEGQLPSPGRALDVGCAQGVFLELLQARGWQVWGLEPARAIAGEARLAPERVHVGPLETAEYPAASFELVTLWDVIEHLDQPAEALARVARWLAPGGRVVIETQDVGSLAARLLGRRWQHYKHDEHLHHFHRATLDELCRRAGLVRVHRTRRGAGKYVDGAFLAERAARLGPLARQLAAPLAGRLRRGVYVNLLDEWIVVARRAQDADAA